MSTSKNPTITYKSLAAKASNTYTEPKVVTITSLYGAMMARIPMATILDMAASIQEMHYHVSTLDGSKPFSADDYKRYSSK